jgi:FMN-dependent NADH-azoreductase
MDLQKGYMDLLLGFIGFTQIHSIMVEPTLAAPDEVAKTEAVAISQAQKIAASI